MELNLDFNLDDYETHQEVQQSADEIELIQLADTHALLPDASMSIQKFAICQSIVVILVQQAGLLKLLRYCMDVRISDPAHFMEVVELPLKGYDASSSACFLLANQNFTVVSLYTGLNLLICSRVQQKSQVFYLTNERFPRTVITAGVISQQNDVVLGAETGHIFSGRLRLGERKWSFDGDNIKAVHILPGPVTGIDLEAYKIDDRLQAIAFYLGASPCSIDLGTDGLPVDFLPANNFGCKDLTVKRWLITVATANGFRLIEGRGVTPGDVLLAANQRDLLVVTNGKHCLNEDKKPLNYEFTSQVPQASPLQNTNCAFLKRDSLTRQPTGWIWLFMQPHTGQIKVYNDVVYSDDAEIQKFIQDGWVSDEPVAIGYTDVKELFSYSKQYQQLATCIMVGQLPPDAYKLHDAQFGFLSTSDGAITPQQFLQQESSYNQIIFDIATQTQTIIDTAAIRESAPLTVTCSNYQCCVSYPDQIICISLITKQFSYRISTEDLVSNLIKCPDVALNFNYHPQNIIQQATFTQFYRTDRRVFLSTALAVFELKFNDYKDLYREMTLKKQFQEALECANTQRQREEVKYYQALHCIGAKKYLEAASLLAQTPRCFEDAASLFISEEYFPGFSQCAYGSKNQFLYLNREAIIIYCEAKLKNYSPEQVIEKAAQAYKMWSNKDAYAGTQQKEIHDSILLEKQITAVAVFIVLQYLIYINELYFQTFSGTSEDQFVQFQIVPMRSRKRLNKQEFIENCYRQNQEIKFMKTRIPELNKRLSYFIEKYNSFLPVDLCRYLLGYSANTEAFETFMRSIDDIRGLFEFYFGQLNKLKNGGYESGLAKSQYENKIYQLKKQFEFQQSADSIKESMINAAIQQAQNQKHTDVYYEFARRIFMTSPAAAQKLYLDFCAAREEVDPMRFLSTFLLVIDRKQPEIVRSNVTDFLVQAQDICGWCTSSIQNLMVRCLCEANNEKSENKLRALMSLRPQEQLFQYQYALRILTQFQQNQAKIELYISHEKYQQAVQLAIQCKLYEKARAAALLSSSPEPLLTALALARIPELGAYSALQFANANQRRVRVENLLQRAQNIKIDQQLKVEIKASMADYQQQVETLRTQIETSNSSTEQIARDLERLRRRFVYIRASQECARCKMTLTKSKFMVFGCGHGLHYDCAAEMMLQEGPPAQRDRLRHLTSELRAKSDERDRAAIENEVESVLLRECLFCQVFRLETLPDNGAWDLNI